MIFLAVDKPDLYVMMNNLSHTFGYLTQLLRYALIIASLLWFIFGILNLWSVSTGVNGQNKFFPSKAQPTLLGSWMQMCVAGLAFTMALNMMPAVIMSSLITGEVVGVSIYSVSADLSANINSVVDPRDIIKDLLATVMQFVGFTAYFRGFRTWVAIGQGTSNDGFGRVTGYFFFGSLCMAIEWVNSLIANTLGYDLFGFFM